MNRRICCFTFLFSFFFIRGGAQVKYDAFHYGTEDGLPQKTVMDIIQDKKGFMWFSTWDGICSFDGNSFHAYKAVKNGRRLMKNKMYLDRYGFIWVRSHENDIYRFDPRHETFSTPNFTGILKKEKFLADSVIVTSSGTLWFINKHLGGICFKDSALTPTFIARRPNSRIHDVYVDKEQNSWLLTENGLYQLSSKPEIINAYFTNGQGFFCALETGREIFFASRAGRIYIYNKDSSKFRLVTVETTKAIHSLKKVDDNRLLIAASSNEFFIYDCRDGKIEKHKLPDVLGHQPVSILSVFIDHQKNAWFETNRPSDIFKFSTSSNTTKLFTVKRGDLTNDNSFSARFMIWEDINNHLWINPSDGVFSFYNAEKDQLMPVSDLYPSNPSYAAMVLYAAFSDKQGDLWISTRSQGLGKIVFSDPVFKTLTVNPGGDNNVRSILEDDQHRIWIATKGQKIAVYSPDLKKIGYVTEDGEIGTGKPLSGAAYTMMQDAHHNIWIGTKGNGVYKLIPGSSGKKFKISHFLKDKKDPYSLSDDKIYKIFADSRKRIWIGTYSGGLNLADNDIEGRFYNLKNTFTNYPVNYAFVRDIAEDRSGKLYVGTTQGLLVLSQNSGKNGLFGLKGYNQKLGSKGFSGLDVFNICTASNGKIYIAVFGGGMNVVAAKDAAGYPATFFNYSEANGLASNLTMQIKEDVQHRLWIISESDVTRFDQSSRSFENYNNINRLIKGEIFSEGGVIIARSGQIMLGTTGGLVVGDPYKIKKDTFKTYVALTGLQLANRNVPIGAGSILSQHIDDTKLLRLNYKQNFITLEFAALNFTDTKQIKYAYKLDGVDSSWVDTKERSAKYINLAPGNYTFHVRSTNGTGKWLDNDHMLEIKIVPAFWQTGWALLLYIVTGLAIIFFTARAAVLFFRMRDRLQLEREQTDMKTNFFTDISHEIRTPLTMVVSPVENILVNEQINPAVHHQLQLVLKNAKRMLRLVNQILDFRKIQNQLLYVSETAIGEYVSNIAVDFAESAKLEKINLEVNDRSRGQKIWVDPDSIEKMMFNLLSNAVKHTPPNKTIVVDIFRADSQIAIQVKDSGAGMSSEILKKLFSRFVSYHPDKNKPSTGIGLSIVKEIVERHGAKIEVNSEEKKGSTFTIFFQTGRAHFKDVENVIFSDTMKVPGAHLSQPHLLVPEQPEEPAGSDQETILLIEDDNDLREYIAGLLAKNYHLLQAGDGVSGLTIAQKETPDFIISDIMMPEMNGIEFLDELRKQPGTSHIPLIFLTAKTDPDTEITAYEHGADGFITKPFNTQMLKSRIKTIIEQRKRLYDSFHQQAESPNEKILAQPNNHFIDANKRFLSAVKTEIENNISDNEFNVDALISAMSTSRSVFVKKIKSLTGQSPIEFMRQVKIRYAAKLIDTQQHSIKEVSHLIGINDTKYFSQRFKEIMGVLPSEYKNKNAQGNSE
jgi:signal transduction histidine kinase/DNA-binding response OmpR family regulator/ligand-binding sensor domain-containing protein